MSSNHFISGILFYCCDWDSCNKNSCAWAPSP